MVEGTILIFIKAPVPGHVKTRLIPALGAEGACAFYRAMAMDTLQAARQVPDMNVVVAYQAHDPFPDVSWLTSRIDWFAQEGQDLGERLIHAIQKCSMNSAGPVLVIGSDLPALTPAILRQALKSLEKNKVVLGPSADGGYYLMGVTRPMPTLFKGIRWSSPQVLDQTRKILTRKQIPWATLSEERDIDTPEDLAHLESLGEWSAHFVRTRRFLKKRRMAARS
jgi:rSAM/selenodomain-associated transferase 1